MPQHHEPGAEAEVDWGEAWAVIDGQQVKVHLFQLRLCHSGAAFASAFLRETQQAFLEAHADAFEFLGGIPGLVRYDNLTSAVKQVLQGPPAGRDRPVRRAALALHVRVAVHAGRAARRA